MCAIYSTISVLMKLDNALHNQCVDGWWCVSFNFINTLMVECIIQFHQHTDGGVYHSISSTQMTHSTISELMKLNDTLHHQCVNEIE
jgi:hypothetical protein